MSMGDHLKTLYYSLRILRWQHLARKMLQRLEHTVFAFFSLKNGEKCKIFVIKKWRILPSEQETPFFPTGQMHTWAEEFSMSWTHWYLLPPASVAQGFGLQGLTETEEIISEKKMSFV